MSSFECFISKDNVKWFKEVIKTIEGCVSKVKIDVSEQGLKLYNLNRSHIMFVQLDLNREFFTEFIFDNSKPVSFTASVAELYHVLNKHAIQEQFDPNNGELFFIQPREHEFYWRNLNNGRVYQYYIENLDKKGFWIDTKELNTVIKRLRIGDTFSLSEDEGSLIINIEGKSHKEFKINKIDFEYDIPTEPTLKDLSQIVVSFESYKEAIMDIDTLNLNNKLYFSLKDEELVISTHGNSGAVNIRLNTETESTNKIKSCYSLVHIVEAIRWLKECKTELKIEMNQDTPIRFIYPDKNSNAFFKSLIAPRIEAED
jgi:DNA polymerase III sliding clamp (beta) subunit (PCNA family)